MRLWRSFSALALFALCSTGCSTKSDKSPDAASKRAIPDASPPDAAPPPPCEMTMGLQRPLDTLDPAQSDDRAEDTLTTLLFEGLTRFGAHEGVAELAVAQKIVASEDAQRYEITLSPTAVWSDGKPVTAHDFVFSVKRALETQPAIPRVKELFSIVGAESYHLKTDPDFSKVGIKAVNDRTLTLEFVDATHDLYDRLAMPPLLPLPAHAFADGDARWPEGKALSAMVFNGPYILSTESSEGSPELVRNPKYRRAKHVELATIRTTLASPSKLQAEFDAGRLDWTGPLGLPHRAIANPADQRGYRADPSSEVVILVLDSTRKGLEQMEMRYAIGLAIRRSQICALMPGGKRIAGQCFPDVPDFRAPAQTDENTDRAQGAFKQVKKPPKAPLYLAHPDTPIMRELAKYIAEDVKSTLGVEIKPFSPKAGDKSPKPHMQLIRHTPHTRSVRRSVSQFLPGGSGNVFNWDLKGLNDYHKEGRFTRHLADARDTYMRGQTELFKGGHMSPIIIDSRVHLLDGRLRGMGINTLGVFALEHLTCAPPKK
ncbi:MAG: ABC transporter substrate-binding protein [Bradymonadia bacterium]